MTNIEDNESGDIGEALRTIGGRRGPKPQRKGTRDKAPRVAATREPARETAPRGQDEPHLKRTRNRIADKFHVPDAIKADARARGMSIEWKAVSVRGQPQEDHLLDLRANHWTDVPKGRYTNYSVAKEGMQLMERPLYLTEEARLEDYNVAMQDVLNISNAAAQTPQGHFPRDHPRAQRVSGIHTNFGDPITVDPGDAIER
jgi:hypothetical protein